MNRVLIIFFSLCISYNSVSQNNTFLFGLNEVPQTLLINPGANVDFQWHIGVPAISGAYLHAGISGFALNDVFANDGIDFNTKLNSLFTKLNDNDFYTVNQKLDIFNIGFRLNNSKKDYLSFGFYEELDALIYHPKDLITLAYEGNQDFDKIFDLRDLSLKAEMLGVYHLGLTRKVNEKVTIGTRLKLYSSVFNITSTRNSGLFFTKNGENNIYRHRLHEINLEVKTSGIIHNENLIIEENIFNRFLASGNMGVGLDFGITYKFNKNWIGAASFQDLGFIRHTKNTTVYQVKGSQDFDGLNLIFPFDNPIDYLNEVENTIPYTYGSEKYTSLRPLKLNGSLVYRYGEVDNSNCLRTPYANNRRNEIGIQIYSIIRPKRPQVAATLFYYKRIAKFLRAKVTYTADTYSFTNIGFGISSHLGKVNLYGNVDNILGLSDISKSNNQSVNFGINIILKRNKNKP